MFEHIKDYFRFKRCSNCLQLGKKLTCNNCCLITYCSAECLESDFDHELECQYIQRDATLPDITRLLLRLLLKIHSGSDKCKKIDFKDLSEFHRVDEIEVENSYGSLIKLIPENLPPYESYRSLFRKILLNSYSIFGDRDHKLGLSFYQDKIQNHSCISNAEVTFLKTCLRISSKTHIRSKYRTTLTIGLFHRTEKYSERKRKMNEMFGNSCSCQMCTDFEKLKEKMCTYLDTSNSILRKCYMTEIEGQTIGKSRSYLCSLRL